VARGAKPRRPARATDLCLALPRNMLRSGLFSSMDSPLSGDQAGKKSLLETLKRRLKMAFAKRTGRGSRSSKLATS
jgi:hypothetical protein